MTRLFDKLNTPVAVVLILAAILAVNGFLFYQQRTSFPDLSLAEETVERTTEPEVTERAEDPEDERAKESKDHEESRETTSDDEVSEEREAEEKTSRERGSDKGSEEEGASERTSERTDREAVSEEESEEKGPPLAGLGDAMELCDGDREDCARAFVSEVSPDARYIGGRTDLASGNSERNGQNAEVLYFEDPKMKTCQFERVRYAPESDGVEYTVILVGAGSFEDERGGECIPEA